MAPSRQIATALASLPVAISQDGYSAATATSSLALSVSAYCGSPKFNASFLQDWQCGPSCGQTSVTDITQFEDSSLGVFGLVGKYDDHCLVLFRGTSSSDGWKTDFGSTSSVDFALDPSCSNCKVGEGFYNGYVAVRPTIQSALSSYGCKDVSLTGHSLGAVLATIAAADLGQKYTIKDVYNFGSPRAGNTAFASAFNSKYQNHWRVTHYKDPIPHAPLQNQGDGFFHVGQEAYYKNTTSEGYVLCASGEDKTCSDHYDSLYSNLLIALLNAAANAGDHLQYMQDTVTYSTDGESCEHVAMTSAVQHAYLTTASYCDAADLRKWDCGTPCDRVKGGVKNVQIIDVPFIAEFPDEKLTKGSVRGFVGQTENRCVLSLREPFDDDAGLDLVKTATSADLEDIEAEYCDNCKVYRVLMEAWRAVELPLKAALEEAGCSKHASSTSGRRLIVTGHGLGASLGALAAFQLQDGTGYEKGTFGIEASFQFGAPRIGNAEFAHAFKTRFSDDMFRVTHASDPYVRFPMHEEGFMHPNNELNFKGEAAYDEASKTSYRRCANNGEDPRCGITNPPGPVSEHNEYLKPLVEVDMSPQSCKARLASVVV